MNFKKEKKTSNKTSNSATQSNVEKIVINFLNDQNKWNLESVILPLDNSGITCQLDGLCLKSKIICEVSARIGKSSSSRDKKIISDATKMLLASKKLESLYGSKFKKYLVFVDDEFAKTFNENTKWQKLALQDMKVEILLVDISGKLKKKIKKTQRKQASKFKK
jgi:hypothetical protein